MVETLHDVKHLSSHMELEAHACNYKIETGAQAVFYQRTMDYNTCVYHSMLILQARSCMYYTHVLYTSTCTYIMYVHVHEDRGGAIHQKYRCVKCVGLERQCICMHCGC